MELDGKSCKEPFELTPEDLKVHPVWEYRRGGDDENISDTIVCPVEDLPVSSLDGRIVGTEATLSNGSTIWVILANVRLDDPRATQHLMSVSVLSGGRIFHLSRYWKPDYARQQGPNALAVFLNRSVDAVFPITYNISAFCKGDPASLRSVVHREPRERLTREEIRWLVSS
jgi:hypothetical protein